MKCRTSSAWLWIFLGGLCIGSGAALAWAEEGGARVIHSPHATYYQLGEDLPTWMVSRRIVAPAAVVPKALANQPVWADMIEIKFGPFNTFIDPTNEFTRQELAELDDDHSMVRAYRLWARGQNPTRARVIVGAPDHAFAEQARLRPITPSLIIEKPGDHGPRPIPKVPAAPASGDDNAQMVKADPAD